MRFEVRPHQGSGIFQDDAHYKLIWHQKFVILKKSFGYNPTVILGSSDFNETKF